MADRSKGVGHGKNESVSQDANTKERLDWSLNCEEISLWFSCVRIDHLLDFLSGAIVILTEFSLLVFHWWVQCKRLRLSNFSHYIFIILFLILILGLLWLGFKYLKGFDSYLRRSLIKDVSDQELLAKLEIADEGERFRALTQCLIHESYQAQVRVGSIDVREEKAGS